MTGKAIVCDTETTGFDPKRDRIVEIAFVDFGDPTRTMRTLVNPLMPIPASATRVHGITSDMVRDAPTFADISGLVLSWLIDAEAFIGYNPWFDKNFVSAELSRVDGLVVPKFPTLVCAKRTWDVCEPKEKRDLQNAYKRFVRGELYFRKFKDTSGYAGRHGALEDAIATAEVLRAQMTEFGLHGRAWSELDPERALWWGPSDHVLIRDDQLIMNFGKHRKTPVHEVDYGFWRWMEDKDFPPHVLMLAYQMRRDLDGRSSDGRAERMLTWALAYDHDQEFRVPSSATAEKETK